MSAFAYHRARCLEEALALWGACRRARYIAGGTDVMVGLRAGGSRPEALISLRRIGELRGVAIEGGPAPVAGRAPGAPQERGAQLGALTTIAEILRDGGLRAAYPVLAEAAAPFASVQVRNLATLGGNLCNASPAADMAPALLVLEARVELVGPAGAREVALEDFFLGPGRTVLREGEVLTAVRLDSPAPGERACFLRRSRVRMDLAIVSVALALEMEGERCVRARAAAGAVAPRPLRLHAAEAVLEGSDLSGAALARACEAAREEIAPITDLRASADYRRHLTGVLLRRAVESLREDEAAARTGGSRGGRAAGAEGGGR